MPCTINLRHDQHSGLIPASQRNGITIYAPEWVRDGLQVIASRLEGVTFNVHNNDDDSTIIDAFTISADVPLSLIQLQKIARNEKRNTSGLIKKSNYKPDVSDDSVIYALKDLIRQCIIVGLDETTHFGGYRSQRISQQVPTYIVDLIGLQFQQSWNTGRLVLCEKSGGYEGCLDQLIYEKVVGEPKKPFNQLEELKLDSKDEFSQRYVPVGPEKYFDVVAYKKFVAADVVLCMVGLNHTVSKHGGDKKFKVHFKFLKYGAGYFAGPECGPVIQQHLLAGVIDGLERVFEAKVENKEKSVITSFEFPFFECSPHARQRLNTLAKKHSLQYKFSRDDALKMTAPPDCEDSTEYIIATTNCADPHAAAGNEMGFGSVDSVIAENLASRGNIFNPLLNSKIQSQFVKLL